MDFELTNFRHTCYRFPMLTCRPWILSEARPPVHGLLPECPIVQALRSVHHAVMCVLIPQPRARLGWRITPSSYMEFTNYRRPTIGVRTIVDRPSTGWIYTMDTYLGFTPRRYSLQTWIYTNSTSQPMQSLRASSPHRPYQ